MTKGIVTAAIMGAVLTVGVPAAAQTTGTVSGRDRAAYDALITELATMEEVLVRTVNRSARDVEQRLPSSMSGVVLFAGPTQVRGFRLVDYGVFFDVEYPVLRRTILWSMQMLESNLEADFRMLQRRMEQFADLPSLERLLRDGEPNRRPPVSPVGLGAAPDRRRDLDVDAGAEPTPDPPRAEPPRVPAADVDDLYRTALNTALVDAVLQYGGGLAALLEQDEWLTVTARDVRARRGRDSTLRVKARDVIALRDGDLTIDAARARVDASPF